MPYLNSKCDIMTMRYLPESCVMVCFLCNLICTAQNISRSFQVEPFPLSSNYKTRDCKIFLKWIQILYSRKKIFPCVNNMATSKDGLSICIAKTKIALNKTH